MTTALFRKLLGAQEKKRRHISIACNRDNSAERRAREILLVSAAVHCLQVQRGVDITVISQTAVCIIAVCLGTRQVSVSRE